MAGLFLARLCETWGVLPRREFTFFLLKGGHFAIADCASSELLYYSLILFIQYSITLAMPPCGPCVMLSSSVSRKWRCRRCHICSHSGHFLPELGLCIYRWGFDIFS